MEKQQIKKILVPLDGSKNSLRGLDKALYLAKEHESSLFFLYVNHQVPRKEERSSKEKGLRTEIPTFMLKAEIIAKRNGIPSSGRVVFGDSGHEIVAYADTHNIDLIVIGARGLSTFKKIFVGSVSSYVMQKAKTAVMVVK
ncbi:MAG: universal stress protein [Thaumarchaeota archaeon]|nr:universal stress protein [Nitrososphaerota archaeon]